ncbi:MAG: hypothetical protein ACXW2E_01270 [Nitrososphaeraceae archaeon]
MQNIGQSVASTIVEELASVQPISDENGKLFSFKDFVLYHPVDKQGDRRHSFIYGWQRYYGTGWIAEHTWFWLKIKGL